MANKEELYKSKQDGGDEAKAKPKLVAFGHMIVSLT
jgi:hypothetical protein